MTTEECIEARIAEIAPAADHFPGVVVVHNLRTLGVEYMSAPGLRALATTLPALRAAGPAYYQRYFSPADAAEYVPKLLGLLERGDDEVVSFFQQVRAAAAHEWSWYLGAVRVFLRDEQGRPLLALAFACLVSPLHHVTPKVARLLEENVFLRQHEARFARLTRRERQVLRLLVLGKNSAAIADELCISAHTVITHRRNINAKLHPETQHDLSRYAYAFDLV